MGQAVPVHDIRLGVVPHSRATVGMGRDPHRATQATADDVHRTGLAIPLFHLLLHERGDRQLILLVLSGDSHHRVANGVGHLGVEIEIVRLVGQCGFLDIRRVGAVGVLLDERLPGRAPGGRATKRARAGRRNRSPVRVDPQVAAPDEVQAGMIKVIVRPIVDGNALGRQPVPRVEIEREKRRDRRPLVMAQIVSSDLRVIVREPDWKRARLRHQQQPHVLVGIAGKKHQ